MYNFPMLLIKLREDTWTTDVPTFVAIKENVFFFWNKMKPCNEIYFNFGTTHSTHPTMNHIAFTLHYTYHMASYFLYYSFRAYNVYGIHDPRSGYIGLVLFISIVYTHIQRNFRISRIEFVILSKGDRTSNQLIWARVEIEFINENDERKFKNSHKRSGGFSFLVN